MTSAEQYPHDVEISAAMADELASWRRTIHESSPEADHHELLRMAATSLWRALEIDRTIHPERFPTTFQVAVDELKELADFVGIGADDAQRIITAARNKPNGPQKQAEAPPPTPLPFIDMSNWDNEPVPEQAWAVPGRIPLRQCFLFSGEGAAGKSSVELHRSAAHVLGRDWLGAMPEPGPAIYIDAEDDVDVIHRRLAAVARHYRVTFAEMIKGGL